MTMKRTFLVFFLLGLIILSFCFHEVAASHENDDDDDADVNAFDDDIVSTKSPDPTREPTPRPTSPPTPPPPTPAPTPPPPTPAPTPPPTRNPTVRPTPNPTIAPSTRPPTPRPTTAKPTKAPTKAPTRVPTNRPTMTPTRRPAPLPPPPTRLPTRNPTRKPTPRPTTPQPTPRPTRPPTPRPTPKPTPRPTTTSPTLGPTKRPTPKPSLDPLLLVVAPSQEPITTLLPFTANPVLVYMVGGADEEPEEETTTTTTPSPPSVGVKDERNNTTPTMYEEEEGNQTVVLLDDTVDVVGTVRFSIVVRNGNRDNVPFSAYEPELTLAVTSLAHQVAKDMEESWSSSSSLSSSFRQQQQQQQQLVMLQVLDLPGSIITQVRTLGFTSNPDVSDSDIFLGGACPITSGDVRTDRCEEISASMGVLFAIEKGEGEGGYGGVDILEQVQAAFQLGLDGSVASGELQSYMDEAFPLSRVSVISGQVVEREGSELYPINALEEGDIGMGGDTAASVPVGAIVGIVLASLIAVVLAIVVCLVTRTRRRQRIEESSVISGDASMLEKRPIPPATTYDVESNISDGYSHDEWSKLSFDDSSKAGKVIGFEPLQPFDEDNIIIKYISEDEEYDEGLDHDNNESSSASASQYSMASSGTQHHSSSIGSTSTSTDNFMSGNRVIDFGMDGRKLREYTPGIDNFDELEAAIMAGDWDALVGAAATATVAPPLLEDPQEEDHSINRASV